MKIEEIERLGHGAITRLRVQHPRKINRVPFGLENHTRSRRELQFNVLSPSKTRWPPCLPVQATRICCTKSMARGRLSEKTAGVKLRGLDRAEILDKSAQPSSCTRMAAVPSLARNGARQLPGCVGKCFETFQLPRLRRLDPRNSGPLYVS